MSEPKRHIQSYIAVSTIEALCSKEPYPNESQWVQTHLRTIIFLGLKCPVADRILELAPFMQAKIDDFFKVVSTCDFESLEFYGLMRKRIGLGEGIGMEPAQASRLVDEMLAIADMELEADELRTELGA